MRALKHEEILLRLIFLAVEGILITQVLSLDNWSSSLFLATFFFVVLLWLSAGIRRLEKLDLLALLVVMVALANVSINAVLQRSQVDFNYIKKYLMFMSTLLLFAVCSKLEVSQTTRKVVLYSNTAACVFLIGAYFILPHNFYMNNIRTNYLVFGFTNPNLAAIFLLSVGILQTVHAVGQKYPVWTVVHLVLAGAMFFFVTQTQSRNTMLAMVLYLLLGLVFCLKKNKTGTLRCGRFWAAISAVWPAAFSGVYLALVNNQTVNKMFSFMVDTGKGLNSRMKMWVYALKGYDSSPVIGAYSQISGGTGTSQMHNTHLDILASYGPLVLIGSCLCFYYCLRQFHGRPYSRPAALCLAGFLSILLVGTGEAAMVSGGMGVYIYAAMMLLLCKEPDRKEDLPHEGRVSQ